MNDEELFELILRVDPNARRIPPGVRELVNAAIGTEREACAKLIEQTDWLYANKADPKATRCLISEEARRLQAAAIRARSAAKEVNNAHETPR